MTSLSSRLRLCWRSGWTSSKVLSGAFLPANNGEGKHCVQIGVGASARDSALGARNAAGSMYIAKALGTCFRCARAGGTAVSGKLACQPPENAIATTLSHFDCLLDRLTEPRYYRPRCFFFKSLSINSLQ